MGSPSSGSTLTTSAPKSASSRPQNGPAMVVPSSRTFTPSMSIGCAAAAFSNCVSSSLRLHEQVAQDAFELLELCIHVGGCLRALQMLPGPVVLFHVVLPVARAGEFRECRVPVCQLRSREAARTEHASPIRRHRV